MKESCKSVTILMDGIKKINGSASKPARRLKKLNVASLNSHLICVLCSGYYIEATAIVECLHTFCRSCIVKYLQSNSFCPICDVQIHQSKPWSSLRPDKTLQDLVYKLVPGLYQNEMRRRRQFYTRLGRDPEMEAGEDGGFLRNGARFFAHDDSISLSLEYYTGHQTNEDEEKEEKGTRLNEKPKRYLQCPAAVTVRHLKKFLRMKYGIGLDSWVDIIYNDECLSENFTLIDVAYTFTWKRTSPMKFSYRIYSNNALRAVKARKNFQTPRLDEDEKKKSKRQSSLEQQMQNEYLGNFNLNPTNSSIYRNQSYNKTKHNTANNNNNSSVKNNNTLTEKKYHEKDDEYIFRDSQDSDEGSRDRIFQSSEESNTSGLQIISEKEESLKGNSEDSRESSIVEVERRKCGTTRLTSFGEEALDGFSAKKLLRSKQKTDGKRAERRTKSEEAHSEKDKRRTTSLSETEGFQQPTKKVSLGKRVKSTRDEYASPKREVGQTFSIRSEEDSVKSNLKNEALRKVFVTKDKPEAPCKKKDGEFRRKKRKKSKHHEGEAKKRKVEVVTASPSIMSFAKDALKFKFKLTPNKAAVVKAGPETEKQAEKKKEAQETEVEEVLVIKDDEDVTPKKTVKKSEENENKKSATDKERLLHLRAVRHKTIGTKGSPKDYINTPPSLTISKIDSSEQQPVKSSLVESRPSLEIMLVNPTDTAKVGKKSETRKEGDSQKVERTSAKEGRQQSDVVDNFGVLDLSEKSTRTKENHSNSASPKEMSETIEKCRKSTHQSILHIAQTLVNRKLSPMIPENHLVRGFEGPGDSSATAAAMRNLKTLSDTAVNILMAAQSKSYAGCAAAAAAAAAAAELQKRPFPSVAPPALTQTANSTKPVKDCENGTGLKIPVYPIGRDRTTPIPPVPNLHEIYLRGRGRPLPLAKPSAPLIKPGQNQTVRQIPNPFVVLNRQTNQNPAKSIMSSSAENGGGHESDKSAEEPKNRNSVPPLQSIKGKLATAKSEEPTEVAVGGVKKNGVTEGKPAVPKIINNNTKTVQNGTEGSFFGLKNGGGLNNNMTTTTSTTMTTMRKIESMAKNIESVAAGLTARAVSNAMIDAK